MEVEDDGSPASWVRLEVLIRKLELILTELDDLGLSRIALPVNEAIEFAKATRISVQNGPAKRLGGGNAT